MMKDFSSLLPPFLSYLLAWALSELLKPTLYTFEGDFTLSAKSFQFRARTQYTSFHYTSKMDDIHLTDVLFFRDR